MIFNLQHAIVIVLILQPLLLLSNENQQQVDSLLNEFYLAESDSARVYSLVRLSQSYSTYDLKSSIREAEKALETARESGNADLLEFAMFNAGNAYFSLGDFETAAGYFYNYLEIQKEKEYKPGIAFALANIGAIRLKMNDFEVAKQCFLEALQILQDDTYREHKSKVPNILNNLGIVCQNLHQYDSSLIYYHEGLRQAAYVENQAYYKAGIFNNIGSLFLEINEPDNAYVPLLTALELRQKSKDFAGLATSYNRLADYYLIADQPGKALEYLYTGVNLAKKVGSIDLQSQMYEKLYNYYYSEQKADSALKYYILYNNQTDTINVTKTLQELTRLELTSEFKEKRKLEQLERSRLNTIYIFTAILLVLVLLVFVLLFILANNRNNRLELEKKNIMLSSQNTNLENENLQKELEIRNKELTTHVMGMIRKNELIRQIVEVLSNKKLNFDKKNRNLVGSIIEDLNNIQDESVWEEFEVRYKNVHNEFYDKLKDISPNLSTNERRLCAFLQLNMTTKEISSLTGQSLRSIEVARTRLRKKLNLTNSETSLTDFLTSL